MESPQPSVAGRLLRRNPDPAERGRSESIGRTDEEPRATPNRSSVATPACQPAGDPRHDRCLRRPLTLRTWRFERRAMGSALRLTLHGPTDALDDDRAGAAWTAVAEEFEAAEAAMSRFREDSELTRLNGAAGGSPPEPVSGRLVRALIGADRAERVTGGRFDPRVIRALDRLGYRGAPLEAPARGLSDGRWLAADVRAGRVALAQPVDLGGIGKGLSLRWAARRLVGIEGPAGGDEPIAVVSVPAGAVATSSVQVNRWTTPDGRPAHHLIDPRTGAPGGAGLLAVTLTGPDPAWAEVWSKVLFLEGAAGIGPAARARGCPPGGSARTGPRQARSRRRSPARSRRPAAMPGSIRPICARPNRPTTVGRCHGPRRSDRMGRWSSRSARPR